MLFLCLCDRELKDQGTGVSLGKQARMAVSQSQMYLKSGFDLSDSQSVSFKAEAQTSLVLLQEPPDPPWLECQVQ